MQFSARQPQYPMEQFFSQAWTALGGSDARGVFHRLAALHSHERAYHDFSHLERMCRVLWRLMPDYEPLPELVAAIFFHDAFYEAGNPANEALSFEIFKEEIDGSEAGRIGRVGEYIMATKPHVSDDREIQLLLDLDLSGLAGDEETFCALAEEVRQEFVGVPIEVFMHRQAKFLGQILARDNIYYTAPFRAALEAEARRNLQSFMAKAAQYQ